MKKTLVLFSILFCVGLNAQKFNGGFELGYVYSTLDFTVLNQKEPTSPKHSLYVSIPIDYRFNKHLSAYTGLSIVALGGNDIKLDTGSSPLHLTTILIPVGLKVNLTPKILLSGGFNLGFIGTALGEQNGEKVKFTDFNTGNHSFSFGGEYWFKKKYFVTTKYNIGMSDILDYSEITMKNNFLQIGVGMIY